MIFLEQVETKWKQSVLTRLRKDFQVGSEDWNVVAFKGQRISWTQDPQTGPYVEVSQAKAIEELEEIPVERNTKEDLQCTPAMHTMYRSFLGQIKLAAEWTQFQCFYKFSRCASVAVSPTVGDVKALNKLARQLKSQPVKRHYWPLTGPLTSTTALHTLAWQCSWENRVSDRQGME